MPQGPFPLQGPTLGSTSTALLPCGCPQWVSGLAITSSSCKGEAFRRIAQAPWQPLNPKQQANSAGIGKMLARHPWMSAISYEQLKELFTYIDNLEFHGELSGRCVLVMERPGVMDRLTRGVTSVTRRCDTHMRILEVKITMNPDELGLGFTGPRLLQFAGTLLHEMCHASILLSPEFGSFSCLECIIYLGMEGHGTLFDALFRSTAAIFLMSTGWTISLEANLDHSVFEDRRKRTGAVRLWTQISCHLPESARNHAGLMLLLNLAQHESDRLVQLIIDGRDVLEIILMFKYGFRDAHWRPAARLIEAKRDPYSFIVEWWRGGTVTADVVVHLMGLFVLPLNPPPPPLHHPFVLPLPLPLPPPSFRPTIPQQRFPKRASTPTGRPHNKRQRTNN